ncbi:and lysine N-methyltransferase EFM7 [Seminavis robusta]|uniref:And lysine N-methyltransferase EFM7 n=1 Tax=Seminavis robusta TaxID=568900 RepID=A0A9N8EB61_9STRA|nr:and lysine N-methyltransferase EFM7 [Seminavis robusta]|eukprot:Sro709_g190890.1 and lysine N-methyltransferase EFM7 (331) ;mRNA; r:32099-33286
MTENASNDKVEEEQDTPWTDDRVRWHEEFQEEHEKQQATTNQADDDEEEEESAFIDPFKDPDPFQSFQFSFQVDTSKITTTCTKSGGDDDDHRKDQHQENEETIKEASRTVDIEIRGYKTGADQVWKSTGLTLWRAAEHLCQYMAKNPDIFQGKSVLELGAGLGLCGILAHKLGARKVCITDGDSDALLHLRENVNTNKTATTINTLPTNNNTVSAHQLIWGKDTTERFLRSKQQQQQPFDVLIASDIIYARCIVEPLWETVDLLLSRRQDNNPPAVFVMAYAKREVPVSIEFVLEYAQAAGFSHKLVDEHPDGIWVYIFQRNNNTNTAL